MSYVCDLGLSVERNKRNKGERIGFFSKHRKKKEFMNLNALILHLRMKDAPITIHISMVSIGIEVRAKG